MEKVKAFFKNDKFAANNGIELVEVHKGGATATLQITENHLNAGGVVQGGALFTLADFAMAAAANAYGPIAFSIQSDIRFLQSSTVGDLLTATAKEILLRRTLSHYRVEILNIQSELIAVFDGICHRKG